MLVPTENECGGIRFQFDDFSTTRESEDGIDHSGAYYVDTAEKNTKKDRGIHSKSVDQLTDQMTLKEYMDPFNK